jgi:hypothetical protein
MTNWAELSRLAGEGSFGNRYWLLPGAAGSSSSETVALALLADQQRLAGSAGNSAAAQTAATITNRSRLRAREALAIAATVGR